MAMKVTMQQFEGYLANHSGTVIVTMKTRTRPKLLVKNRDTKEACPWSQGVERVAFRQVILGAVYENSVNNQRAREGNDEYFDAAGLWVSKQFPEGAGERDGAYTVRHKGNGKRYFAVRPCVNAAGIPLVSMDYWLDVATGEAIYEDLVTPYLSAPSTSARQDTNKPVPWRTVELVNVEEIKVWGETFEIVSDAQALNQAG
jgi:hypothetical protein